jgi:hypothetical protein
MTNVLGIEIRKVIGLRIKSESGDSKTNLANESSI